MMKRKWVTAFLCAALLTTSLSSFSVSATLLKSPGTAANAATEATPSTTTQAKSVSGAFTGSTPLTQYLYEKLSTSPNTLSVPVSKLSSKNSQAIFTELGDALEEAFLQNGLVDHMTDMKFTYTPGKPNVSVKLTFNVKDAATRQAHRTALIQKADSIIAQVTTADMTAQQKAEALYNYVSKNVTYDYDALDDYVEKPEGQGIYARQTAYASLVEGKSICQGFSRGYKLLCDRAGVPCVVVFGTVRSNGIAHSWNRIYVTGTWATADTSNPQLRICAQDGIFISDATQQAATTTNKTTIMDSKADLYF